MIYRHQLDHRLVRYHGPEWDRLTLEGWLTIWVYRFGVALLRRS